MSQAAQHSEQHTDLRAPTRHNNHKGGVGPWHRGKAVVAALQVCGPYYCLSCAPTAHSNSFTAAPVQKCDPCCQSCSWPLVHAWACCPAEARPAQGRSQAPKGPANKFTYKHTQQTGSRHSHTTTTCTHVGQVTTCMQAPGGLDHS